MTVKDAIQAIRVMLGSDTADAAVEIQQNEEVVEHKHAEAVLVDDTEVYTEGDLAVGAVLKVKVGEGEEDVLAPSGKHETKDGLIVTVGEGGLIEAIEEVEAPAVEEEATEEVEEEMAEEPKEEKEAFDAEGLLAAIAQLIAEYKEGAQMEVAEIKEELSTLTERFNEVADLPATKPVRKSFMEDAKAAKKVADARFERLAAIRNKK